MENDCQQTRMHRKWWKLRSLLSQSLFIYLFLLRWQKWDSYTGLNLFILSVHIFLCIHFFAHRTPHLWLKLTLNNLSWYQPFFMVFVFFPIQASSRSPAVWGRAWFSSWSSWRGGFPAWRQDYTTREDRRELVDRTSAVFWRARSFPTQLCPRSQKLAVWKRTKPIFGSSYALSIVWWSHMS